MNDFNKGMRINWASGAFSLGAAFVLFGDHRPYAAFGNLCAACINFALATIIPAIRRDADL